MLTENKFKMFSMDGGSCDDGNKPEEGDKTSLFDDADDEDDDEASM